MNTASRTIAVTGGAAGIGYGVASSIAHDGDTVVIFDRNRELLAGAEATLSAEGLDVVGIEMDVSSASSVLAGFETARARVGRLDGLVSNVGIAGGTPVIDMTDDEWRTVLGTNLDGTFYVTRAAARWMAEQGGGGKIVCLTSLAGRLGRMGAAHYCASKAGLEMLVKVLAMELAAHKININLVSPGFVNHGFREGIGEWVTEEYAEAIAKTIPWGRLATVDDVVPAVKFLLSPDAGYISGTLIATDGAGGAGRYSIPVNAL